MTETSNPTFPCASCGFLVFDEPVGSYDICPICDWEDDHVQLRYPRMGGGANRKSLLESQIEILESIPAEIREHDGHIRHPNWRPLRYVDCVVESDGPKTGLEYFQAATENPSPYYWDKPSFGFQSMPIILVAMPEEWNKPVRTELEAYGCSTIAAYSQDEVETILAGPTQPNAVIIVSDWAMAHFDGEPDGIVKQLQSKIPTITIITETTRKKSGYRYMDEIFFPPAHEYTREPFSLDELIPFLKKIGIQ